MEVSETNSKQQTIQSAVVEPTAANCCRVVVFRREMDRGGGTEKGFLTAMKEANTRDGYCPRIVCVPPNVNKPGFGV